MQLTRIFSGLVLTLKALIITMVCFRQCFSTMEILFDIID